MKFYTKLNIRLLYPISIIGFLVLSLYISFFSKDIKDLELKVMVFLGIPIICHYIFNIILDLTSSIGNLSLCYSGSKINKFLVKRMSNLILLYLLFCTLAYVVYLIKYNMNVMKIFQSLGYTYLSILFMLAFTTMFLVIIKSGLSSISISLVYFYLFEIGLSKGFLREYSLFSYFKGLGNEVNNTFIISRVLYIALTTIFFIISIKIISKDNKYKLAL